MIFAITTINIRLQKIERIFSNIDKSACSKEIIDKIPPINALILIHFFISFALSFDPYFGELLSSFFDFDHSDCKTNKPVIMLKVAQIISPILISPKAKTTDGIIISIVPKNVFFFSIYYIKPPIALYSQRVFLLIHLSQVLVSLVR